MESLNILEKVKFDQQKPIVQTILQGQRARVVLLCLSAGQVIPEHSTSGAVLVQGLSGRTNFFDGDTPIEIKAGTLFQLAEGRRHRVEAQENSVLLVTVLSPATPSAEVSPTSKPEIDVRQIPRPQRHPLVFSTFDKLAVGQFLTLINDHDPVPLRRQLEALRPGESEWQYVERGPEIFRIRITRLLLPEAVRQS